MTGARSPLATWTAAGGRARILRALGRRPLLLRPRDREWRRLAPDWDGCLALARAGLPFHVVADRRYDRSGNPKRLDPALAAGATVYLPQVHESLPRVARLMVALRAEILGPFRAEASFLFLVGGCGREGMGLHHDGAVDAFWVQLEGRRTVTIGPAVAPGTRQDLDPALPDRDGNAWRTFDLPPGSLFYLPPYTPHRVICRTRSLALSLTWTRPRRARSERARVASLTAWPVVSGRATAVEPASNRQLWTQVPAVIAAGERTLALETPAGRIDLPASARPLAACLGAMPALPRRALRGRHRAAVAALLEHGVLGARDLPVAIVPAKPRALDGWGFG